MGNIQYFTAQDVIPATITGLSAQADSPASRLSVIGPKFERSWRSTSLSAQTGTITFTNPSDIAQFFVAYDANFTSLVFNGETYIIQPDLEGTCKLFKELLVASSSSATFTIPVQATTDGATHYRLGRLFCLEAVHELEHCPSSISREIFDPQITAESELGVFETLPAGSPYSRESWSGQWLSDELPNVRALFSRRAHQWVGMFRNLSAERDYEFQFTGKDGSTRINYGNVTVDMDVSWRQQL